MGGQESCPVLWREIKETCGSDVHLHVHVHVTTGVTMVSLMKAIEDGADCVDTSISSLSLGPGHNPTESPVEMLEGTGFDTKLDKRKLLAVKRHFDPIRPRYKEIRRTAPAWTRRFSTVRFRVA